MPEKRRIQEPPIRIKPASRAIVERIADATGVPYIQIVDWAVEALGNYWEHHGKRLLLPLRFHETFSVTTIDPTKPLTLFEPPRARQESSGGPERNRMKKGSR